jgi:hypothetical protein
MTLYCITDENFRIVEKNLSLKAVAAITGRTPAYIDRIIDGYGSMPFGETWFIERYTKRSA